MRTSFNLFSRARNRGLWAAVGTVAVVQALTLCLLVLHSVPLTGSSRQGRSLLAVSKC